jgi:hypothetical protein
MNNINANISGLKSLNKFVGIWNMSGDDLSGQVRFDWFEGGFFLVQQVNIIHFGKKIKGVEYIEYDVNSKQRKSHFFDNAGNHFTYVWEIRDKEFTIWFGEKDSDNYFEGRFDDTYHSYSGDWKWPDGGYKAFAKKVL